MQNIFKLIDDNSISQYTGSGNKGVDDWVTLDTNGQYAGIVASTSQLVRLDSDKSLFIYEGIPCSAPFGPGWGQIDNNTGTIYIASDSSTIYQLNKNGQIWQFTGLLCGDNDCTGWTLLGSDADSTAIAAGGGQLYQQHQSDGNLWRYIKAGGKSNNWSILRKPSIPSDPIGKMTVDMSTGDLYLAVSNAGIWQYKPITVGGDDSWQHSYKTSSDNNIVSLFADNGVLYMQLTDGNLYSLAKNGDQLTDPVVLPKTGKGVTSMITLISGVLYQLQENNTIWQFNPGCDPSKGTWTEIDDGTGGKTKLLATPGASLV